MIVILGEPTGEGREVEYVRIDKWDSWNAYCQLGLIALPLLKQLQKEKHGSAIVDIEDVPPELQPHGSTKNESLQYDMFASDEHDEKVWEALHARWDWVLEEMIFAFESIVGDNEGWEAKYWSGENDIYFEDIPDTELSEMKYGPNHTRQVDWEGRMAEANRIQNGFRLFGKYYQSLWD